MSFVRRMLLAGVAGAVALAAPERPAADELGAVRWEYRPLLVFTPDPTDPRLSRQTTMLAEAGAGVAERRLAVYIVEMDRVFTTFGAPAPDAEADTLRRRFRVPDDTFRVVLVGLDGGTKLTVDEPLTMERLFATIDGMPMRRQELRDGANPR